MVENALEHVIYGTPIVSGKPASKPDVLAISPNITAGRITDLQATIPLAPLNGGQPHLAQAIAMIPASPEALVGTNDAQFILARTHPQQEDATLPIYQYVFFTESDYFHLGGELQPLLSLISNPIPSYKVTHAPLDPIRLPAPVTWTRDKGVALLKTLLDEELRGDMTLLLQILGAALSQRGLVIRKFAPDANRRLALVRGLSLLLPSIARPRLSFSLNSDQLPATLPRLIFSEALADTTALDVDWEQPYFPESVLQQPYVAHLAALWQHDVIQLVEQLHALDVLAGPLMRGETLASGLAKLAERHQHDLAVIHKKSMLETQELIAVLNSNTPPKGHLRFRYVEQLLRRALDDRDTDAAEQVTVEIDQNPALDDDLRELFVEALESQPDAVYVLARTRLKEQKEVDKRWLSYLHEAGRKSLDVAIESSDPATIASWLTLVAREPLRYNMADILYNGILKARPRAQHNADLAAQLLALSVKRQPELVPVLLEDATLRAILPGQAAAAVNAHDPAAIEALAAESRELFLLAIHIALEEKISCVSSATIRTLYELYISKQTVVVAAMFRPLMLIKRLAQGPASLMEGALHTMLTLLLAADDLALFYEVSILLADHEPFAQVLVPSLEKSNRSVDDIMTIISNLLNNETLVPQQAVSIYTMLLTNRNWNGEAKPMIEQLARVLSQYADTQAAMVVLWNIVELSGELKNEQMLRVGSRRLMTEFNTTLSEAQLVENLARLRRAMQWHASGKSSVLRWWRDYARSAALTQLQKIDRELEGQRTLDDLRAVVQTTIAMRKVLAQRSLQEFSDAVATAYNVLQALADGFDPTQKQSITVDSITIRSEIDARSEELPADVRHVLATNLKELAQLMTSMSDNRSKAPILRSDDSIERQLVTGEQQPQSAIDVMRWLSGYLDGLQRDNNATE